MTKNCIIVKIEIFAILILLHLQNFMIFVIRMTKSLEINIQINSVIINIILILLKF